MPLHILPWALIIYRSVEELPLRHKNFKCRGQFLSTFLDQVVKIKGQQMSYAVRYSDFCKGRNIRHLAFVGLEKISDSRYGV
jgi:hypothetical protein